MCNLKSNFQVLSLFNTQLNSGTAGKPESRSEWGASGVGTWRARTSKSATFDRFYWPPWCRNLLSPSNFQKAKKGLSTVSKSIFEQNYSLWISLFFVALHGQVKPRNVQPRSVYHRPDTRNATRQYRSSGRSDKFWRTNVADWKRAFFCFLKIRRR